MIETATKGVSSIEPTITQTPQESETTKSVAFSETEGLCLRK
jgi:hypothetical protein